MKFKVTNRTDYRTYEEIVYALDLKHLLTFLRESKYIIKIERLSD